MYDHDKVDELTLALLYLGFHSDAPGAVRAWKSFDWDAMDRLHQRGWIGNPKSKAKSVVVTEEGKALAEKMFSKHFGLAV